VTREDIAAPGPRPALRRWLATVLVLVVAAAAGLGNAPGPQLSLVRHETIGKYPPNLNPNSRYMAVTLPENRRWVALYYWRYGQTTPILQIRARSTSRPLPRDITLSYGLVGVRLADYDIVRAKGEAGKALVSSTPVGWYSVLIEDATGNRSVVFFEAGKKVSRGYFSCSSKPRLIREETARKLAPPNVRSHFEGLFGAVPRLGLKDPPPAPPGKKHAPGPAATPPVKAPPPAPPAGK
jgi:hypothetical protein